MTHQPLDSGRDRAYADLPALAAEPRLHLVPEPAAPLGAGVLPAPEPLDQELICRRVVRLTHDVVTVVLEPTRAGGVRFAPGQYLTLAVELGGRTVERCYTISSPPTRPHLLTITVKRVPGGEVSGHLHDRLRPGDRLRARGPLGRFAVTEHPAPRHLLLSAGSGITPTLSTLRTMADLAEPADVVVVHHARTPDDLACRAEVEAIAAGLPGLRVHWVVERDAAGVGAAWAGPRGLLSAAQLGALVPDVADREVLTCGPPGYMAAARAALAELGVDPARCHEESFVLAEPAAEEPVADPGAGAATVSVRFARSGREVRCAPGTTVLAAATEAGVALPSSCGVGLCGTCVTPLLSGSVDMRHQGGIRPREEARGGFLPCCSTPEGDLVVDA